MKLVLPALGALLVVSCGTKAPAPKPQADMAAPQPAKTAPTKTPEEVLGEEFMRKDIALLGLDPADPAWTAKDTNALPPDKQLKREALAILEVTDWLGYYGKQQLDKAVLEGKDIKKAGETYDLLVLRTDMIRAAVKASRLDRAQLIYDRIKGPATREERMALEARRIQTDAAAAVGVEHH